MSLEKSWLLAPGFFSGVSYQEVHESFGPFSLGVWRLPVMASGCISLGWAVSLRWDASMHLMSEQLLYLTKIGGNVVFSSCQCLHWILQDSDEMGWMPKAWGLQWLSTHCQSLTSHQLLGPPGRSRATGRAHRWIPQVGILWQQISFSKKQKDFIAFALEILCLNNDRPVIVWPGADDPVVVLNNWLCSSGPCWWGGRVVLTLGK